MRLFFLWAGLVVFALPGWRPAFGQARPDTLHMPRHTERLPVFPGADSLDWHSSGRLFTKFLESGLRVPPQAVRDQVAGRVFLSFSIDEGGRTTRLRLVKGLRADVDSAVLRHARRLYAIRWRPGTQDGRPVQVGLTVPIGINLGLGFPTAPDSLDLPRFTRLKLPTGAWNPAKAPPAGAGILYGSCLQRLGFSSGGLEQHVRVVNLTTGQVFRLNVKPALRSRRENPFCYALPAGRYALSRYEFGGGFTLHEERLLKRPARPAPADVAATRFVFTIAPGRLYYVGIWNFANADEPLFLNEKELLDPVLLTEHPGAPLADAVVALPQ